MSSFLFHNKFHRSNHHTLSTIDYTDSAIDPIAASDQPFLGTFFNYAVWNTDLLEKNVTFLYSFAGENITTFQSLSVVTLNSTFTQLTASGHTSSKLWHSAYTYINQLSAGFNLYVPVYTTTKLLSNTWVSAYSFYTEFNSVSTFLDSTYMTTSALSARWPNLTIALRLPQVQSNLRAKAFKGTNVTFDSTSAYWDLSSMQVGFAYVTGDTVFKNIIPPEGKKKGGEYTLVIQQDGFGGRFVEFESDYVFAVPLTASPFDIDTEIVSLTALSVTVIRFVCDGERLFGKPTQYYYLRDVIWTYFAGNGLTLDPNPAELYVQQALRPRSGIIVLGTVVPARGYSAGTGITILSGVPVS